MRLNSISELREIAKLLCRDLRKNETEAEKVFWDGVRNRKLSGKKYRRQFPIFYDLEGRESFFVADFCCLEDKTIIELDGPIHKYQLASDSHRTEILEMLGMRVIRFSNDEVLNNFEEVLRQLTWI